MPLIYDDFTDNAEFVNFSGNICPQCNERFDIGTGHEVNGQVICNDCNETLKFVLYWEKRLAAAYEKGDEVGIKEAKNNLGIE